MPHGDTRPAALGATELLTAYAAGTTSPVEVLDDVRAVVEAREPTLNAFWVHDLDAARDAARSSEQRWRDHRPRGPLDGVPVTVKENLGRAGVPMPAGNAGVTPTVPRRSSPVVERLDEAGAVLLGSTVMPDWGMLSSGVSSLHGITRSPWDPSLTTGGSSSGAGAAAAAGYGPLHVGTDIGGSIRLPGTWLGLTTLKPSAGRVPLDAPYLGRAAGPLTRSTADAALLLSVLSRPDVRDWTSLPPQRLSATVADLDPKGLRVALLLDAGCGSPVETPVREAVERAAEVFASAGAVVEHLAPFMQPGWLADLDRFWRVRSLVELEALDEAGRARVLPFVRRWVEAACAVDGRTVMRDYASTMAIQQATVAATAPFDLVLSPVAPMSAFPAEWPMPWGDGDAAMSHIGFTAPFNLSGQPAGTTNAGFTPDGRTIGVQVAGRRFDDEGVLRALHWFERHRSPDLTPRWPIHS
ncbi:amidase [Terrabacter aeriphilus]|uniref:Amidase n=1 Tax=Terrabacter aeriphilus TaxID=515662 RepID=A0ABP9JL33_9MICO